MSLCCYNSILHYHILVQSIPCCSSSFRNSARMHHPDMNQSQADKEDAKMKFVAINNASELLVDSESRQAYHTALLNKDFDQEMAEDDAKILQIISCD